MRYIIIAIVSFLVAFQARASVSSISSTEACGYLTSIGLNTRGWKNHWGDMYGCSTAYKDIGRGSPLSNNIAYYVDGNRTNAQIVKLVININNKYSAKLAHDELLRAAKELSKKITGKQLPSNVVKAITNGNNLTHKVDHSIIKVVRIDWPTGKGYEIKFTME